MALIRRSIPWRALLSNQRGLRSASEKPNVDEISDGEFRKFELHKPQEEPRVKKALYFGEIGTDRANRMPVDQDWPSVWPAAASFRPSVVPLPIRMGYVDKRSQHPPGKHANVELMKIPNFLHLTPPAIKRHCEALKKFCTKWPEALTDKRSENWITITTSDYVHSGPSIRDERSRIVTLKLNLSTLDLDAHARDKFIRLVGPRYNPNTDEVVIVTDRCPVRRQNLDYLMYVFTALFHESWVTEPWELTEIQEADLTAFTFEKSRSQQYIDDYVARAKDTPKELLPEYAESLTRLKNEGENAYNLDAYKKVVCGLMKLQLPQGTAVS